jgi:serine/threonine protein kinase
MLVLEDPGGKLLEGLLDPPMAVGPFLHRAPGLVAAIARLHQRGLIHMDIKPPHILVDPASGAVHVTGFGIASRLPRQCRAPDAGCAGQARRGQQCRRSVQESSRRP